jgi:steroid delta-isomerase-like uncharacterized protein
MATTYSISDQLDALNRHDPDAFAAFYRDDATLIDPAYPEPIRGRDAIHRDFSDFISAFPDLKFTMETVVESGNTIAFNGTGKGTHQGPLVMPEGEIPATGKTVEMSFASFVQVDDDGRIIEERRYYDLAGIMQQLGVMGG